VTVNALVPAFNEEQTVADVVEVLRRVGLTVLVVDDGSTDATASRAAMAGATVLRMGHNAGKAEAMAAGLRILQGDPVAMFDADLVGLRPDHVRAMLEASALGYDMVCGLRDYGLLGNPLQTVGPLITGERIVRRWIFKAMPADCWRGYAIETAMNHACSRGGGKTAMLLLDGLTIRTKLDKGGWIKGIKGQWNMFSRLYDVQECLDEHGRCEVRR